MAETKEAFGISEGSIMSQLHELPIEVQNRYRKNEAKYEQDYRAAEYWARSGFMSGYEVEDG